jgi:subtilisin family serine protease
LKKAVRRAPSLGLMVATVAFAILAVIAVFVVPAAASAAGPGTSVTAGPSEVIVQFSAGTSKAAMMGAAGGPDVTLQATSAKASAATVSFAVYTSDSLSVAGLIEQMRSMPGVVAVSPNYQRSISMVPNDPLFDQLWGLENTGQEAGAVDADIDATAAWDAATGKGTVVASIDTGIDYDHPDLRDNMWRNPGEVPGDGIDNDGNGYVDDVYGIDAYAHDSDPMDESGHGTHSAGIMAAVGNNALGVIGVAYQAKIMDLRFLDAGGHGSDADAITCINYAIDMKMNHGVNVVAINASWGGRGNDTVLMNAVQAAANAGIVFVAAAGNGGANDDANPFYPAAFASSNVVAVGASTSFDQRASFSNYGATNVDLFAPGSSIVSTYQGSYAPVSGTSMAAPHVTGTVALVAELHPGDSVATRISRVLQSVDRLLALSGLCATGGRLNAAGAVATGTPTITSLSPTSGSSAGDTSVVINGTGFVGLSGAGAVTFGGTNATAYTVDSPTQITATAPAHAEGTVSVRVATAFGTSADTADDDYTYVIPPAPSVSGLSPDMGPVTGGTSVIVSGSDFSGATAVTFGGVAASRFVVLSGTRIRATTPARPEGTVQVEVTAPGGRSADTLADDFTYVAAPTISSLSPDSGPTAGGTSVTIEGSGFVKLSGATAVTFGGVSATSYSVDSSTRITATAPAHLAGTVRVQVTAAGGATSDVVADDYTYVLPAPQSFEANDLRVAYTGSWGSFATASASGGSYERANTNGSSATIYFNGDKLDWIAMKGTTTGIADVSLDGVFRTSIDLSATSATYKVNVWSTGLLPSGVHYVTISWKPGNAAGKFITLDRVDVLGTLLYPPPSITSVSPATVSTAGGSIVVINGSGFTGLSGAGAVTFGGENAASYTVKDSTKITAVAPAHSAGAVRVQVTAPGGTTPDTGADDFTYVVTPATTRVDATFSNKAFVFAGTWGGYGVASAFRGSYLRSSAADASVVIPFKGTQLDWIATQGTTPGAAAVYVDNVKVAAVDLAAPVTAYQQKVFSTGVLTSGYHTVKIVSTVAGKYLTIDAVDVAGSLTAPVRAEDASSPNPLVWSPGKTSWTKVSTSLASGGSYAYINATGASITMRFTGVRLDIIARSAANYGIAYVSVDGGTAVPVNLYSSTPAYKKLVWSTGFVAPGNHTVVFSRRGTKSSSSSGYGIDLDAVDLTGVWR